MKNIVVWITEKRRGDLVMDFFPYFFLICVCVDTTNETILKNMYKSSIMWILNTLNYSYITKR